MTAIREAVLVLDEADVLAFASPATKDLLGLPAEGLLGRPFLELVHEADRPSMSKLLEELRSGLAAVTWTVRLVGDGPSVVPAEVVVTSLAEDPGMGGLMVSARRLEGARGGPSPRRPSHHAQAVLDSLREGVLVLVGDGTVLSCNTAAPQLLGVSRSELVGSTLVTLAADLGGRGGALLDQSGREIDVSALAAGGIAQLSAALDEVVHGWRRSEVIRWLRYRTRWVSDPPEGDRVGSVVVSLTDVTAMMQADRERRVALGALAAEREFLHALLTNLEAGIVACDGDGRVTLTNATFRWYGGYSAADVAPGAAPPVEGLSWPDGTPLRAEEHPLVQALGSAGVSDVGLVMTSRAGERRVVSANSAPLVAPDGRLIGAVANFNDVTAMKETESELADLALHDPLTGCANRLLLADRAALAADLARREGRSVGLLLIDLDQFKATNDTFGHLVGDEVLVEVARRLRAAVRPGDTVARYGGDEFAVLCQVEGGAELAGVQARIRLRLSEPCSLSIGQAAVSASVGAAVLPAAEADLDSLLGQADTEMYQEKQLRRR